MDDNRRQISKKSLKKRFLSQKSIIFFVVGTFLIFAFFAFTLIVRSDALRSFDFNTTVRLQAKTPLRFDPFFSILSVVGRFEYTATLLLTVLAIYGFFKKQFWFVVPLGLFCFAHVVELIGKTILEQPGPPRMFLRSQFSEVPGLHVFTNASYPSGHSLRIVFLGLVFAYILFLSRLPQVFKIASYCVLGILVTAMLISRVSLGEHWTTDVVGGTILGLSFALLSLIFL